MSDYEKMEAVRRTILAATNGAPSTSLLPRAKDMISTAAPSDDVAAQVRMVVEKIVKQLNKEYRQVTGPEAQTLGFVDSTLEKATLPNIQAAHDGDIKLLKGDCNDDLHETAEIEPAKESLDAARTTLADQQDEEKKNLVAVTSQGPPDSLDCTLPSPTQIDETPDAMGDFMKAKYCTWSAPIDLPVFTQNKFYGCCWCCGKYGHRKAECQQGTVNTVNGGGGSWGGGGDKGDGRGKGGKGSGKAGQGVKGKGGRGKGGCKLNALTETWEETSMTGGGDQQWHERGTEG